MKVHGIAQAGKALLYISVSVVVEENEHLLGARKGEACLFECVVDPNITT